VSDEMIEDAPSLSAYLNSRLRRDLHREAMKTSPGPWATVAP